MTERSQPNSAHSLLPWHTSSEEALKIKDAKGDSILSMFHTHLRGRRPASEVEANAALIVKAVNNHDRLVEALREIAREQSAKNAYVAADRFQLIARDALADLESKP